MASVGSLIPKEGWGAGTGRRYQKRRWWGVGMTGGAL